MSVANAVKQKESILTSYACEQLANIKPGWIRENLLLELVVCAFFHGATQKLDKQSGITEQDSRLGLITLVMATCNTPHSSAASVLDSIKEMTRQYGIIENIVQQGSDDAENWLACEASDNECLQRLVEKYRGHAMHEFGIGTVNIKNDAQQKLMFLSLDESISKVYLRTKKLICISFALSIFGSLLILWQFNL